MQAGPSPRHPPEALIHGVHLLKAAVFHLQDGVRFFGYRRVVGDDDDGAAVGVGQVFEDGYDVGGVGGIQVSGGFVRQDDFAPLGQSSGAAHPLLFATGQVGG